MKKPIYKKWWFILLSALVVIYALSAIAYLADDEKAKDDSEVVETSAPVEEEKVKEETPEVRITNFINEDIGKETNNDKERIVSVGYVADTFEIVMNADDSLTDDLTRTSMLTIASDVFQQLQGYEDVEGDIIVGFMLDLVDEYGNTESSKVLSVRLTQEELDKINFENFNYENYPSISDVYYEHPALSN